MTEKKNCMIRKIFVSITFPPQVACFHEKIGLIILFLSIILFAKRRILSDVFTLTDKTLYFALVNICFDICFGTKKRTAFGSSFQFQQPIDTKSNFSDSGNRLTLHSCLSAGRLLKGFLVFIDYKFRSHAVLYGFPPDDTLLNIGHGRYVIHYVQHKLLHDRS